MVLVLNHWELKVPRQTTGSVQQLKHSELFSDRHYLLSCKPNDLILNQMIPILYCLATRYAGKVMPCAGHEGMQRE
jgi:hypothetical protein